MGGAVRSERWVTLALVAGVLAGWEVAARTGLVPTMFFPPPTVIGGGLLRLVATGNLLPHAGTTLARVGMGVLIGCVPACILGLAMGWSRRLGAVLDPLVAAFHPLPKIAILPLLMVVFGIGESSKVAVIAFAAFFPMLVNSMAGVSQISPQLFEVARSYGATRTKVFTRVVLPGSLPLILTGLRISLNVALLIAIAAEMIAAQTGLGVLLWLAWETARPEELFAALFVIALIGVAGNLTLSRLSLRLLRWQS